MIPRLHPNLVLAVLCLVASGCSGATKPPAEDAPSASESPRELLAARLIAALPAGKWDSIEREVSAMDQDELKKEAKSLSAAMLCRSEREKLKKDRRDELDKFLRYHAVKSRVDAAYPNLNKQIYEEVFGNDESPYAGCAQPGDFDAWCAKEGNRLEASARQEYGSGKK